MFSPLRTMRGLITSFNIPVRNILIWINCIGWEQALDALARCDHACALNAKSCVDIYVYTVGSGRHGLLWYSYIFIN